MAVGSAEVKKQVASYKKALSTADGHIKALSQIGADALKDYGHLAQEAADIVAAMAQVKIHLDARLSGLKSVPADFKRIKSDAEMALARFEDDNKTVTELFDRMEEAKKALAKNKMDKSLKQKAEIAELAYVKASRNSAKVNSDAMEMLRLGETYCDGVEFQYDIMSDLSAQLKARVKEFKTISDQADKLAAAAEKAQKAAAKVTGI
ncbi:hypothetical protein NX862_03690 [Rhodobacter sp. KR11]|jgi:ABC-type transporter Mla subunit MlaD|uniref:hypothetical protein n=1 Tax=Rhodobacter sp. KR11 TaxID=2974588 RepID=UPI00222144C9|nr:hypothetical protein [Rhodobacter sp. KR11]MCW1917844.1 hypothetical protein [Rhodobacter sp. KR11]